MRQSCLTAQRQSTNMSANNKKTAENKKLGCFGCFDCFGCFLTAETAESDMGQHNFVISNMESKNDRKRNLRRTHINYINQQVAETVGKIPTVSFEALTVSAD